MSKHYHHLTRDQRCQISVLKAMGLSQRKIAMQLTVDQSTISRELTRNRGGRGYLFKQADAMATYRRCVASSQPKRLTADIVKCVEDKLREEWSPEQISGRLKLKKIQVSHESIYQHVWKDKRQGGTLYKHLRHSGKKYNRRSSGKAGRGCIPNRIDIQERPLIVEKKSRIGDWEGDTMLGAKHKGGILSYVDRKSKYTLLTKLKTRTAKNVLTATLKCFSKLPHVVHTITYDNGKEFSEHQKISKKLNAQCYFATPYCSWERGLNEHTNGLVRQYVKKSSDLNLLTSARLVEIENLLNTRPRKVLQYKTPREVLLKSLRQPGVALHC